MSALFSLTETWLALALLSLIGLGVWKGRAAISGALRGRIATIERDIAQAASLLDQAEQQLAQAKAGAKTQSERIAKLEHDAKVRMETLLHKNREELQAQIDALKAQLHNRIANTQRAAFAELQHELVAQVTSAVITQQLPALLTDAHQRQFLAAEIAQLEQIALPNAPQNAPQNAPPNPQ